MMSNSRTEKTTTSSRLVTGNCSSNMREKFLIFYRPESNSLKKCIKSLLYIHNETGTSIPHSTRTKVNLLTNLAVNIYSHLIGSFIFAIFPVYFFRADIPPRYKVATHADLIVCSIYFIGVAICFFLSAT
jgi:adiponectin receptor